MNGGHSGVLKNGYTKITISFGHLHNTTVLFRPPHPNSFSSLLCLPCVSQKSVVWPTSPMGSLALGLLNGCSQWEGPAGDQKAGGERGRAFLSNSLLQYHVPAGGYTPPQLQPLSRCLPQLLPSLGFGHTSSLPCFSLPLLW